MLTPRSYETIKSVDHLSVDDINKSSGKSSWTFVFKIGFLCFTDQTNKKIVYRLNNNEKQILKVTPKLFPLFIFLLLLYAVLVKCYTTLKQCQDISICISSRLYFKPNIVGFSHQEVTRSIFCTVCPSQYDMKISLEILV